MVRSEGIIHIIARYCPCMKRNLSKSEHGKQQHDVELFIAVIQPFATLGQTVINGNTERMTATNISFCDVGR